MMSKILNKETTLKVWNQRRTEVLTFAGSLSLFIAIFVFFPYSEGYGSARAPLAQQWVNIVSQGEDWQHCFLVIPAFLLLVGHTLLTKRIAPASSPFLGWFLLVLSLLAFYVGYRISTHYLGWFALQGILIASVATLLGWRALWLYAFPLIFLLFAWPLPFLDNYIAFPLRMLMSSAAGVVLDSIGLDVIRQGTGLISAPDPDLGLAPGARFSVDVADPCSGIRSLFALLMVSALYGYFTLKSWWQQLLLFFLAIPLAVAGNLVRILTLTLGTVAFGAEFAIGKHALTDPSWFHMGAGYLVFAVALTGMVAFAWLLKQDPRSFGARLAEIRELRPVVESKTLLPSGVDTTGTAPRDEY